MAHTSVNEVEAQQGTNQKLQNDMIAAKREYPTLGESNEAN